MSAPRYAREIPQRYRFEATRCQNCRKVAFPPRQVCSACQGEAFEPLVLSDEGALATWTVIHVAPKSFAMQTPYIVGIIELPEGVRVTAQLVDCDPSELDFGIRVRRVLRKLVEETEGGIIHYGYKFVLAR